VCVLLEERLGVQPDRAIEAEAPEVHDVPGAGVAARHAGADAGARPLHAGDGSRARADKLVTVDSAMIANPCVILGKWRKVPAVRK
jgi:hypothetical protein